MSDLDDVLNEVWKDTAPDVAPALFNAAVFEQIARRKAQRELGVAALIAVAVWAVAMVMGQPIMEIFAGVSGLVASAPVLLSMSLVVTAMSLLLVLRTRLRLDRDWWLLGVRT